MVKTYSPGPKSVIDIVSATPETVDSLMKLDLAPEVDVEVRSMDK